MVLLAAFSAALSERLGARDVVVASPVAGRVPEEFRDVVGFFADLVLLRVEVDPAAGFLERLRAVRAEVAAAFAHREVPLQSILRELGDAPREPFHAALVMQEAPEAPGSWTELEAGPASSVPGSSKFPVALYATPFAGGLQLTLSCGPRTLAAGEAAELLARLVRLLERAAAPDPAR
jgi:non-ribosomal peptide synthetase component F